MRSLKLGIGFVVLGLGVLAAEPLVVIGPWSGAEADPFVAVLEAFQKETGIAVEYRVMRAEDIATVFPAQFAAGLTPGDLVFGWGWWIKEFAGHMVDLSAEIVGIPFTTEPIVVEGRAVGIPYVTWVKPGFWYRKSFFAAHGLTPPTSWEEFLALLEKLETIPGVGKAAASGDGVGWPLSDMTEHFIITFGGLDMHLGLINGTIKWQSPEVRTVFENYLIPFLAHASEPIEWTAALDMWWDGKYGIYFMGNWLTGMVKDPTDLGVFTLPGCKAVVGGTDYMFIPKYSKRVEDARKLLAFLVSKEGVALRVSKGGKLSMRADVGPENYPPAEAALAKAVGALTIAPDMDDTIGGDWQRAFWDQLKLLWVKPAALDDVLRILDELHPAAKG
ncbi:MAG: extracellular solute-binding protein [Candidatus Bipolaricaulaceae bacterium]